MRASDLRARLRARGWLLVARVPWPLWWPLVGPLCVLLALVPNGAAAQWATNFAIVTGTTPTRWDVVRGLWSWARNTVTSMQLTRWSRAKVLARTHISADDEARLRASSAGPGSVLGLSHSGSWDLAGAWACQSGLPVSSVAENLPGEEFRIFLELREALGFRIYGHTDPAALRRLADDVRAHRVVCLLSDRDFSERGVPVVWRTPSGDFGASMPPGPALLALRTGADLMGLAAHYEGGRMVMVLSEPITPDPECRTHLEKVTSMTQQLCDFLNEQIRRHPHDWHMLQPFFGEPR